MLGPNWVLYIKRCKVHALKELSAELNGLPFL